MKRAVLMSRVSSEEQARGYSLDIQVEKLLNHCRKENIEVVNIFKEDHSAKDFNRPEFKKFLNYVVKNKGKIDLLLIVSWDRFSRNVTASFAMLERLKNYGIAVQAIEQPLDLSIPENLMMLSMYLSLPDIDNKRRSMKITEGVRAAKKSGRWQGKAPFGYVNSMDDTRKPILIPDKNAIIVKDIFNDIANGKTQAEVKQDLLQKGIYFTSSSFSRLVSRPSKSQF